jgi:hypothetical protein
MKIEMTAMFRKWGVAFHGFLTAWMAQVLPPGERLSENLTFGPPHCNQKPNCRENGSSQ